MTPADTGPPKDQWYACDFETTTDLDGDPQPWTLNPDTLDKFATLQTGDSRLIVSIGSDRKGATRTITATRNPDGTLTATTRTGRVRVWSWAIAPVGEHNIHRGTDIAGFVDKAAELGGIHWFHNLRFDGAFLDAYLQSSKAPAGVPMRAGAWRKRQVPTAAFSALISDSGAHYSRNVRLYDGRTFEVRDSLKKFPSTSIAQLARMFDAPTAKGEIDYEAERPTG